MYLLFTGKRHDSEVKRVGRNFSSAHSPCLTWSFYPPVQFKTRCELGSSRLSSVCVLYRTGQTNRLSIAVLGQEEEFLSLESNYVQTLKTCPVALVSMKKRVDLKKLPVYFVWGMWTKDTLFLNALVSCTGPLKFLLLWLLVLEVVLTNLNQTMYA